MLGPIRAWFLWPKTEDTQIKQDTCASALHGQPGSAASLSADDSEQHMPREYALDVVF